MAYRKLKNGGYQFQLCWNYERHRKTVSCPASHVDTLYRQWEREIYDGVTGKHRLDEALNEYLEWTRRHKSPIMIAMEEDHATLIRQYFGNGFLHEIKRHHVQEFAAWRKKHSLNPKKLSVSDSAVKGTVQTFSFFMGWCKEREYIRDNPVFKMRLRGSVPRVTSLTPDQIKAVLAAARGHQVTFLLTALTTGMRHREILGLRWKDILLDSNLITLSGERTKSHRNRQIPIPDVLARHLALIHAEAVQTIVRAGQEPATALPAAPVVMYEGRQIKSFKTSWALICRKLCLKGIRIHDLRHTYATTLRSSGVTLLDIKELLGHQDLQTTQRYAHFDGAIRSNLSVFDKILGDGVPA